MSVGKITQSQAADRAAVRLQKAEGSMRVAFDRLELGWTLEDVCTWAEGGQLWHLLPDEARGRVVGAMMAFAMVCVERERGRDAETLTIAEIQAAQFGGLNPHESEQQRLARRRCRCPRPGVTASDCPEHGW